MLVLLQAELLARVLADGVTDSVSGGVTPAAVAGTLTLLGTVFTARAAVVWVQQVVARRAASAVKQDLRRQALDTTQRLGPAWLAGQRSGGLVTLLGRGLDALDPYFVGYLPQLFVAAVVPLAVIVRLLVADLTSAVIICVTLPLIPIFGVLVGMQTKAATQRQWRALERLGGHFLDIVSGLPTLRAFGRAKAQAAMVRRTADDHRAATMKTLRVAFLSALVLELVATLSVALVAVPVGLRLLGGGLDLHTALLVLLLAPEAYLPLRALGSQFHASAEGLEVAERTFAVIDAEAEGGPPASRVDAAAAGRASGGGPVLVLDAVTVAYAGRPAPALDGVTLAVETGERVGLIGPSGAGKSTVLGLVLGLVHPTGGQVVLGGATLGSVDLDQWRRRIAWVPQRPHLFARTVAENIRLGRPGASDRDIRRAAEQAQAAEFIEDLPAGYDTRIGERGFGLSAGQRQRIALARAFVRDAPLVLLDEPTAGLDARSEAAVVDAARRLMSGRTVLVVAHRPAMIADVDRVIRLDHGQVVDGVDGHGSTSLLGAGPGAAS